MADIIDIANERCEELLEQALVKRKPSGPKYIGRCHNCKSLLVKPLRFCDADCRDDWEKRNHLLQSQFADGKPKDVDLFDFVDETEEFEDGEI